MGLNHKIYVRLVSDGKFVCIAAFSMFHRAAKFREQYNQYASRKRHWDITWNRKGTRSKSYLG